MIIKRKHFILISIITISLKYCSPVYHSPVRGQMVPPTTILSEDINNLHYISGDFSNQFITNHDESNFMLRSCYIFVHSSKYYTYNIGITGMMGKYWVEHIENYHGYYPYYGIGPYLELNIHFPIDKNCKIGIGRHFSSIFEFGPYSKFREEASQKDLIEVNKSDTTGSYFSINTFYPFINFKINDRYRMTVQCSFGRSIKTTYPFLFFTNNTVIVPSIMLISNKWNLWLSWNPNNDYLRSKNEFLYKYGFFDFGVSFPINLFTMTGKK